MPGMPGIISGATEDEDEEEDEDEDDEHGSDGPAAAGPADRH
jgi:hypothetical protein